ncbi:MAG: leucine-rich repeat protein [Christensenellales bacterium]
MQEDITMAAVQIENNTQYSMSTVVNLALADQYLLDRDITFNITEKSSEVYVRCALKFTCTNGAEVAKDMIKFQDYKLGSNSSYSWQQFGEYFYLCDETGIPKTIERNQAGQVFTFIKRENLLLPRDAIVNQHFTSSDQVKMTVEVEAIQGRNLEDSSIYELNQYFLSEIPSDTYSIKFHDVDGSILSEQTDVAYGDHVVVPEIEKEKASDHTTFAYWSTTEDGQGLKIREDDESRVFSNISQNMEVWPVYVHDQVKIDVSYGEGGVVTPGSTLIDWGTGKTFRVVADSGYGIKEIKRDGVVIYDFSTSKIDNFDYVLENVVADTSIEVTFEPVVYEIIVISVGNGTVEPGSTTAVYGSSKVFTMTPDEGYRIWSITLDGVDIPVTAASGSSQRYTLSDINSDHILSVKFVTSILKITTVAGSNGSIKPYELEVEYDSFASVSVVPNEGYEISAIYVDGVMIDAAEIAKGGVAQNVTFEHVTEDHEVRATFSKIQLTITASAGEGGTISPSGEIVCDYGTTQSFDIIPDKFQTIDKIYVDGAEVAVTVTEGDTQTYVFEDIKDSHTIFATFTRSYIKLDINGGSGSQPSISYSLDGTKFTLSSVEPKGPGGKEFYYYSTRAYDDEKGQLGDRYDLGYEYDIPDLESVTTLYAIYLEPTEDVSYYSQYMVFPKGTQSIKRIGLDEAMNEAMSGSDNELTQAIMAVIALALSTTQQDTNLVYCTLPAGLNTLEWFAFSGCTSLSGVSVPASLGTISMSAFSNTTSLTNFTMPYSCVSLGTSAFENSGVQHIKMNNRIQSIGSDAFKASSLKEFKVQRSITSMGKVDSLLGSSEEQEYADGVFHECADLEKIDFSEQSSFLGQTLQNCSSLSEVILPQPLTSIPDNQFRNCQSLSYVSYKNGDTLVNKFPSTLKKIGNYAFFGTAFTDLLLDNCSKVAIGDYAFASSAFETLTIASGKVDTVGTYAFSNSPNLKTVDWQIEYKVPEFCFAYSKNLQTFSTTSLKDCISNYAFVDCSKLSSLNLNISGEFVIYVGAFKNCAISELTIPEGVTNIGAQAFYGNLFQELIFPSTLTTLADDSLQSCSNLERFELQAVLSSTITNLNKVGNGPTWYIEGEPYLVGTESSSAPNGIGPIGVYTIYPGKANQVDWEWIEVISDTQIRRYTTSSTDPKTTISSIETASFAGTQIGKKYITKYAPEEIAAGALEIAVPTAIVDLNGTIHDIEGIVSFEANAVATEKINGGSVSLMLMSGLTYVGPNCFNSSLGAKLSDISVPMTIKYVGENAFQGTNISSVHMSKLEYVGSSAFKSCSNLTSAEFSDLITEIPESCFQNSGLTSFVMPANLTKIASSAFAATNITKLYFPSTLAEIGSRAFVDCTSLTSVEGLSNTQLTAIQTETFKGCSSLNKVYLPSSLKSIGSSAFDSCTNLTYLTFGSSLETIDSGAFNSCSNLSSLEFPATLTTIGNGAFNGCSSLLKITFKHTNFTNINAAASVFSGTTSSLQVYIQNGITLDAFKAKFDGTSTDRGFAEDAKLFYQNASNPLASYKSKEWQAVRTVVVYCGEGGSATIKFGSGAELLVQSTQQKTFSIINGTNYELLIYPDSTTEFFALVVGSDSFKNLESFGTGNKNKKYTSTISDDTNIQITFNKPVVYLDENGADGTGWKKHSVTEGANKESFTINDDAENYTKGVAPFYFYSTISTDNETKQIGKRFDIGVTYPVSALGNIKRLYAIYLDPTPESNFTITAGGTISLKSGITSISNLVIPKTVGGTVVTGIAARGFSNAPASGIIDINTSSSIISGLITMPSTVTSIGARAFAGNTGINSMFSLPYALSSLGDEAFALCKFTSVNINIMKEGSNVVKFEDNILYTTGGAYQFALGTSTNQITNIDSTVILPHAFADSKIKQYNDFGKITNYGNYAFSSCSATDLVITFTKNASEVTFGVGVFEGTSSKLRIYVPSGDVENYINKFTSQLGFHNGALIYDGQDSTVPYAQYYEGAWYRIYKVTTSDLPTGGKSIQIYNLSAQDDKSMTFAAYTSAFGGNIDGYYREDWKLSVVVISDSTNGYTLKTFEIGKKQSNGTFSYAPISLNEGTFDASGSQFTYEIAANTRKQDWDIKVTFEYRTQNVTIYVDGGVNTSSMTLSKSFVGPTSISSGDYSGYSSFVSDFKYNTGFTFTKTEPKAGYFIVSFKYREYVYNQSALAYEWTDWQYLTNSNFSKLTSYGYNSINGYAYNKVINDVEFVVKTQYSPFVLKLSGTYTPMGFEYNSTTNQYEQIVDNSSLVKTGFASASIPTVYEDYKQGNTTLYYFLHDSKRFDTGISYPKSEFSQNTQGYFIMEGKYFTPIPEDYYDTTLSGIFKLTTSISGSTYAIPKTVGGEITTLVRSNLNSNGAQLFAISSLTLPKTITSIEEGAFAMSKINGQVYLPTNLTNIVEGALTTSYAAQFNQTRVSSKTYQFAISGDKNYITMSSGTILVTANSNVAIDAIPGAITKLGAYVFAGRSDAQYSDANCSVVSYGKGVFFNSSIRQFTFSKDSNAVSFDGLLVNLTSKSVVYVNDEGYMTKLNNRGFWSYSQTAKQTTNPYSSMYLTSSNTTLFAIYINNSWKQVYFYKYNSASTFTFTSNSSSKEFVDNNKTYICNNVLNYTITHANTRALESVSYYEIDANGELAASPYWTQSYDLTSSITEHTFETTLEKNTSVVIVVSASANYITIKMDGLQTIDQTLLEGIKGTDVYSVSATQDGENISVVANADGTYTMIGVSGSTIKISLTLKHQNSIFTLAKYNASSFGDYDYAGVKTTFDMNEFIMPGNSRTYIIYAMVLPISLDINGGTGTIPSYSREVSGDNFKFVISKNAIINNGNASLYYFSNNKDALDFSDTRYDMGQTYSIALGDITATSTRRILYARYAEYNESDWTMEKEDKVVLYWENGQLKSKIVPYATGYVTYNNSGASGSFLSSSGQNSSNFVVVPKTIDGDAVTGLKDSALSSITSNDVKYVLMPHSLINLNKILFSNSNNIVRVQLPSGVSSIQYGIDSNSVKVGSFANMSNLTGFTLNPSLESTYSVFGGALYNKAKTLLICHPQKLEMSNSSFASTISEISAYACENCSTGSGVLTLPNLNIVRTYAFSNATALHSISVGKDISRIDDFAFYRCTNLKTFNATSVMEYLGYGAFFKCSSLEAFYGACSVGVSTFRDCSNLSNITFTDKCTSISQYAFANCSLLSYINIVTSTLTIDTYAFDGATNLSEISAKTTGDLTFADNFMSSNNNLVMLVAISQQGELTFSTNALSNCNQLYKIQIAGYRGSMDISTFSSVAPWWHSTISFSDISATSVVKLSADGYYTSNSPFFFDWILENVEYNYLTNTVTPLSGTHRIIGYRGTETEIEVPYRIAYNNNVYQSTNVVRLTSDGSATGTTNITAVDFRNMRTIGDASATNSLFGASNQTVTSISFTVSMQINKNAFKNCTALSQVNGGDKIAQLGVSAFENCSSLTSISLGGDLASIPDSCFKNTSLTTITIPGSVTSIGSMAFENCSDMANIKLLPEESPVWGTNSLKNTRNNISIILSKMESYSSYKLSMGNVGLVDGCFNSSGAIMYARDFSESSIFAYFWDGRWRRSLNVNTLTRRGMAGLASKAEIKFESLDDNAKDFFEMILDKTEDNIEAMGKDRTQRYKILDGYKYRFTFIQKTALDDPYESWIVGSIDAFNLISPNQWTVNYADENQKIKTLAYGKADFSGSYGNRYYDAYVDNFAVTAYFAVM